MVTTLHETEESLRGVDPDSLREMVYQAARSHIGVCQLTSQTGGCAHISPDETRGRVDALSVAEMADILAPTAWIAVELHRRLGG
jgi:hypothetical protein